MIALRHHNGIRSMTRLEQARTEIVLLHEQIEAWFRGEAAPEALDALIACFDDDFAMVTVRGERLDRDSTRHLFARLGGARPGIAITIDDVAVTVDSPEGCMVSYREIQVLPDGSSNQRHSVAWLSTAELGRPRWRFLQETSIPQAA
ncbi:hypothetical protein SAMN04487785_11728 [Dyella jiangningensis]|uniref:DUF4440 domain-containing protein n=1 Tax=Dyella sp. AtDHG13 TaxID=1938897 RepID=UPI0008827417|nr:DUF4440 domain-containing protein [Dyella sp. AtDHG13]PXV59054.1 hypothetical protein BDW41_10498 [Dyella sp. AtDHG13]SDL28022.1 hypothetical protein SAMN04487785_11728 [Dyella jiangningensis]